MRDHANVSAWVIESMNAHFIIEGLGQPDRLVKLNGLAIRQVRILLQSDAIKAWNQKISRSYCFILTNVTLLLICIQYFQR